MPFTEKICPNCLKSVPVDTEQEESFCVYCGKSLATQDITNVKYPDDASKQDWEKLYDKEEYQYIITMAGRYFDSEDNSEPSVYYLLSKLKQIYAGYHEDIDREESGRGVLAKIFSNFSRPAPAENSFHEKFFSQATQAAGELAELLNSIKNEQAEFSQKAAGKAMDIFIVRNFDYSRPEQVAYQALEKCAIPYISLLSDSYFEELFVFYKKYCKQNFCAREVLKALKQEQKSRKAG